MPNAADIAWFKQNFENDIEAAIASTPFQETGDVWPILRFLGYRMPIFTSMVPTGVCSSANPVRYDRLQSGDRRGPQSFSEDESRPDGQADCIS